MSYLVFARKYRPEDFASVQGQEHVTRTLKNAIKKNRVGHAYLFCGPRGVGKTSIARIFSKALNCTQAKDAEPCGVCDNCRDIKAGKHLAVREIDGASHNSVDNVRELVESFRACPPPGVAYKIYIIDEVHMLSTQAFNALLKSLEEPPPQTIFMLATTEPHKILDTVISRCQRFDLRAMTQDQLLSGLQAIVSDQGLDIDAEVLRMISRLADGSMRDGQSLLERVSSYADTKITLKEASEALGAVDRMYLESLSLAIIKREREEVFSLLDSLFANGFDPALFLKEFVAYWRELLRASFGGQKALTSLGMSKDAAKKMCDIVADVSKQDVQDLVNVARDGADRALRSNYPLLAFEALVVQMTCREPVKDIADIVQGLRQFSMELRGGTAKKKRSSIEERTQTAKIQAVPKKTAAPKRGADSQKKTEASKQKEEQQEGFDWQQLCAELLKSKAEPFLVEQLKRCSAELSADGVLTIKASEFLQRRLSESRRLAQIEKLLSAYVKQTIRITFTHAASAEGAQEQDFGPFHERVKELKEFFPGSIVEKVKH